MPSAICLVLDRLHSGYLGAYGNSWIDTPALDHLAFESFVFDQMLIDSPELDRLCRSYWLGWHALAGAPPQDRPTLPGVLRASGVHTALLSDDQSVCQHALAVDFDEIVAIDPPEPASVADEGEIEQTHLAGCFAQVIEWMQSARQPYLLWCHLASLGLTWDAPLEFRGRYWQEGDAEPTTSARVPERLLAGKQDRDEVLAFSHAYAGQVSLLDDCLGALGQALREHAAARETLLLLTSARGFPLGEHRRVGSCDEALYAELVHVPLLLRFPDGLGAAARSQALAEPADLYNTLLEYWQLPQPIHSPSAASLMPVVREEVAGVRDRLILAGRERERAMRTPAWYLRAGEDAELYVKPDDRWEVNNVTVRCREVAECLQDALAQGEQTLCAGRIADLPPLSDVLMEGLE